MMKIIVLSLLATASLAGCTDGSEDGFFQELADVVTGGGKSLEGVCGHAYNDGWAKQILIDVTVAANLTQHASPSDAEVDAMYRGTQENVEEKPRPYAEKNPDAKGCVAFKLDANGQYMFTAYAESKADSQCLVSGRLDGGYTGDPVVGGSLHMDKLLCWGN